MSSKRRLRRRACERKIKHKTLGAAICAIKSVLACKGDSMMAYKCPFCGFFHCGHGNRKKGFKII